MTPADLAESMVPVACELACTVRDRDPVAIADVLDRYTAPEDREVRALLVVLAAMMPVEDATPAGLLAWAEEDPEPEPAVPDDADGTFTSRRMAAYARHRAEGMCVRRAAAAVWVSPKTAGRYEAALAGAGEGQQRGEADERAA